MKRSGFLLHQALLGIVSLPLWSRIWGRIMRIRRPRILVRRMIRRFQNHYRIKMDEFVGEAEDYRSLADFFVRRIDPEKRPLRRDEHYIVSPADGVLSELEAVHEDRCTQVKGRSYPLSALLGEKIDFSEGWHMATIYLSPSNYHRFHYPLSGTVTRYRHEPGRLFPVNAFSAGRVDRLYVRNERVIVEIESGGRRAYVVAVGATFVGGIRMEFASMGRPSGRWVEACRPVSQLDEMGRFEMGSTIVLVLPRGMVGEAVAEKGNPVRVGDPLFRIGS
jgi:phosphatidylserine decarboxylase